LKEAETAGIAARVISLHFLVLAFFSLHFSCISGEIDMRVFGIAAIVIALASVSVPVQAQQTDPHTQGFRAKLKARYLERRDRFMHKVKNVYFAVGCKVLAREAGILPLTSSESYLAYIGEQTMVDTRDESLREAAMQEGTARAAMPGECDYFRKHPEVAEALRREASVAAKR
jgi:hypothetical protein